MIEKIKKYRVVLYVLFLFFLVGATMFILPTTACEHAYLWGTVTSAIAMFLGRVSTER